MGGPHTSLLDLYQDRLIRCTLEDLEARGTEDALVSLVTRRSGGVATGGDGDVSPGRVESSVSQFLAQRRGSKLRKKKLNSIHGAGSGELTAAGTMRHGNKLGGSAFGGPGTDK